MHAPHYGFAVMTYVEKAEMDGQMEAGGCIVELILQVGERTERLMLMLMSVRCHRDAAQS